MDILDGNETRQMEPALARSVIRAVSLPDVSRTIDPFRLTSALVRDFVRRSGKIVNAEVRGFAIGSAMPTKALTDGAPIDAEQVVPASGRGLSPGDSAPLEARHVVMALQVRVLWLYYRLYSERRHEQDSSAQSAR